MKQPLSYIHPNAKIAKNVVIEPFTSIDGFVQDLTVCDNAPLHVTLNSCDLTG